MGRMLREPFRATKHIVREPLRTLHMDLVGPGPPDHRGNKYGLIITDGGSRYSFAEGLKQKSEAVDKTETIIATIEKQSGHQVKVIRSDNGGEFVNRSMEELRRRKGIRTEPCVAYQKQQNGTAENMNRQLITGARTIILGSGLPKSLFWLDALKAASAYRNSRTSRGETIFHLRNFL